MPFDIEIMTAPYNHVPDVCKPSTGSFLKSSSSTSLHQPKNPVSILLPGGHVRFDETSSQSLVREFKEETGVDIICGRLIWLEECFWQWSGKPAHTLAFYHWITLCNGCNIPDNGEFILSKDNCHVRLEWIPVEMLKNITIYPSFIKEQAHHIPVHTQHFISRER